MVGRPEGMVQLPPGEEFDYSVMQGNKPHPFWLKVRDGFPAQCRGCGFQARKSLVRQGLLG